MRCHSPPLGYGSLLYSEETMFKCQTPFVELFNALCRHRERDAYADVLLHWLNSNTEQIVWLDDLCKRTMTEWGNASTEDICRLYALSRVTSILLLRFQTGRADGTDYLGPSVSIDDFQSFHEQLGFTIVDHDDYHPFFHEILTVHPARNEDAPIELADYAWPCLMLGDMSYCRAGVIVEGGSKQINKSIAESSTLYWTYRRKDRPYRDLSQGWGHNSQWRTAFRRDFQRSKKFHFNVDGKQSLNDPSTSVDDLPRAAMIELVRNRGMIYTDVGDDGDLFPYDYSYSEDA